MSQSWLKNLAVFIGERTATVKKTVEETYDGSARAVREAYEAGSKAYTEGIGVEQVHTAAGESHGVAQQSPVTPQRICQWHSCNEDCAQDYDLCYDHLYQRNALDRESWLQKEKRRNEPPTPSSFHCKWKSCTSPRSEAQNFCAFHERESEQKRARQCGNKLKHVAIKEAQDRASTRSAAEGLNYTAYKCTYCDYFHIGKS